jgi:hypothetical protein
MIRHASTLLVISLIVLSFSGLFGCGESTERASHEILDTSEADGTPTDTDRVAQALNPELPNETSDLAETITPALPLPGFGAISGACGVLDDEDWGSAAPGFFVNHIDFADDPYDDADYAFLSPGGQKIFADGNAGGSSIHSEIFAYEVLLRCELAELMKTETEILYLDAGGKITDLLVFLDERRVGVSVTRAVGWPKDDPYTEEKASELLEKKLQGVLDSTSNVDAEDAWARQILHILAYGDEHAASLEAAWQGLDDALRADTFVIVTVTDGDDGFMY